MFNLNALLKFINVNNDGYIQKSEIQQLLEKQKSPSIFNDYFNSISSDVDNNTFINDMLNIIQKAKAENNQTLELDFADENDANKYEQLINDEHRDNNGYFQYSTWSPEIKTVKSLDEIPTGSHSNIRDARGCDITQLDLTEDQLLNLCIDKTTVMTPEQKAILEPYMEATKNPGLGIHQLHQQGLTGKGVNIAIIDQPLGMHQEYADNIIGQVHDINSEEMGWNEASMHGAAVTSIAVGENTGVAPDAGLVYYSAVNMSKDPEDIKAYKEKIQNEIALALHSDDSGYVEYLQGRLENIDRFGACTSNQPYVDAINKILDANEQLPENERVSVVSISWGFDRLAPGYEELQKAIQRAKEQGVFIVSTAIEEHYSTELSDGSTHSFNTCGANRNPKGDLDDAGSYEAGAFWKEGSEGAESRMGNKDTLLLVPMDHRTVADFTDGTSYRYEGNDGGMSWSTPWLAGMYVLAKQADPSITPETFWKYALETSDECRNNDSGEYVGRIINPSELIQRIQGNKVSE